MNGFDNKKTIMAESSGLISNKQQNLIGIFDENETGVEDPDELISIGIEDTDDDDDDNEEYEFNKFIQVKDKQMAALPTSDISETGEPTKNPEQNIEADDDSEIEELRVYESDDEGTIDYFPPDTRPITPDEDDDDDIDAGGEGDKDSLHDNEEFLGFSQEDIENPQILAKIKQEPSIHIDDVLPQSESTYEEPVEEQLEMAEEILDQSVDLNKSLTEITESECNKSDDSLSTVMNDHSYLSQEHMSDILQQNIKYSQQSDDEITPADEIDVEQDLTTADTGAVDTEKLSSVEDTQESNDIQSVLKRLVDKSSLNVEGNKVDVILELMDAIITNRPTESSTTETDVKDDQNSLVNVLLEEIKRKFLPTPSVVVEEEKTVEATTVENETETLDTEETQEYSVDDIDKPSNVDGSKMEVVDDKVIPVVDIPVEKESTTEKLSTEAVDNLTPPTLDVDDDQQSTVENISTVNTQSTECSLAENVSEPLEYNQNDTISDLEVMCDDLEKRKPLQENETADDHQNEIETESLTQAAVDCAVDGLKSPQPSPTTSSRTLQSQLKNLGMSIIVKFDAPADECEETIEQRLKVTNELSLYVKEKYGAELCAESPTTSAKATAEFAVQTDELLLENPKKLNEKYKRKYLASSTSDLSLDDLSDNEFIRKRRRRRRLRRSNDSEVEDRSEQLTQLENVNTESTIKSLNQCEKPEEQVSNVNDSEGNDVIKIVDSQRSQENDDIANDENADVDQFSQPEFNIMDLLNVTMECDDDGDGLVGNTTDKNDETGLLSSEIKLEEPQVEDSNSDEKLNEPSPDGIFDDKSERETNKENGISASTTKSINQNGVVGDDDVNDEDDDDGMNETQIDDLSALDDQVLDADDENDMLEEREIRRLTNFSSLEAKRSKNENHQTTESTAYKKPKKRVVMLDILKEETDNIGKKDETDESDSDTENTISEEQFLQQKNLELKKHLLESDSDSEYSDVDDNLVADHEKDYYSSSGEDSNESLIMDKFLDSMSKKEIENEIKHDIEKLDREMESINAPIDGNADDLHLVNGNVDDKENTVDKSIPKQVVVGDVQPEQEHEFDIALDNFLREDSSNQEELLNQVIESGGIDDDDDDDDDDVVDKVIGDEVNQPSASTVIVNENKEDSRSDEVTDNPETSKSSTNKSVSTAKNDKPDDDDSQISEINNDNVDNRGADAVGDDNQNEDLSSSKTKLRPIRNNLEKEIFSKNFLDSEDNDLFLNEELDKKVKDAMKKSSIASKSDDGGSQRKSGDDSDCEILDVSMFQNAKKKHNESMDIEKLLSSKKLRPLSRNSAATSKDDDCIELSSDSDLELEEVLPAADDEEDADVTPTGKKRRAILTDDQLTVETKQAQKEESERVKRLEKKTDMMSQRFSQSQNSEIEQSGIILDYDSKRKVNICVHPEIVKQLKPHQIDGVKFMYDSCYGSVDSIDKYPGSGCILAHCMGLGKTLQLIALLHTLIRYPQLKTNRILVICPKSTVMNWYDEIQRWLGHIKSGPKLKVFYFPDYADVAEKVKILTEWHNSGSPNFSKSGCLLVGYEAFRTLVFYHTSKKKSTSLMPQQLELIQKKVEETLLSPGADLIICDEGHVIKNRKSATSSAVSKVRSKRRIILTGTPIQNNLKEYYVMVNFIKPSFLGTEREFANLYSNPIRMGQHKDSSKQEIKYMKQRSFVLHKKLSKFVQRREAAVLKQFLPEKFEYVLFIPMTETQERLYEYFLANNPLKLEWGGKSLIPDYTFLRKIWTHPKVLENAWQNAVQRKEKERIKMRKTLNESDDDVPDDVLDSQSGSMSVTNDWWRSHLEPEDLKSLRPSNKLRAMFEILKLCEENGEKCLIFSAFVAVLNVVEYFMQLIHRKDENCERYGIDRFRGPWELGYDYLRLDGKTPKSYRHSMITKFNDPTNHRTKCFLISAKAGGQGINLIGANRVIILDTSWNPSNDQQNIFRVFRLGQKRPCFIYRLLAMGTMEEKVYSRSVTKQAMSFRVVDEQQIDRHYNMAELGELYTLTKTDMSKRPTPIRPTDNILSSLLHNFPELVYKYHEHDSLLENKVDQDLSEADKAEAWAAYEKDVNQTRNMANGMFDQFGGIPGLNPNNPGINTAGYRMGSGLNNYPYGYTNKYGNFGIMNSESAYASSLMSYLNSGYQPGLMGNYSADPNLLRMSQMFPFGSLTGSPPGGQSPIAGTSAAYGSPSSYFGTALTNPSGYYKSPTPPASASTIRPMTGGFSSLSDMANYLRSSTGNTPPPQPVQNLTSPSLLPGIMGAASAAQLSLNTTASSSSSTMTPSIASAASYMTAEEESIWKKYYEQVGNAMGLFPPSKSVTSGGLASTSSSVSSLTHNLSNKPINHHNKASASSSSSLTTSLPSNLTSSSSTNILTSSSNSVVTTPPTITASASSAGTSSPSIPTSVITKPSPKSQPSATTLNSTPTPKSTPIVTQPIAKNIGSRDPYSPPRHVVSKSAVKPSIISTTTTTTTTTTIGGVTITPTQTTPSSVSGITSTVAPGIGATNSSATSQTVVKNINMGIVYPKAADQGSNAMKMTNNPIGSGITTASTPLGPQKILINKNVSSIPTFENTFKQAAYKKGNTTITPPSTSSSSSSTLSASSGSSIPSTLPSSSLTSIKHTTTMKPVAKNSAFGKIYQSKLKNALQLSGININELSKAPGLSIIPVQSSKTGTSTSSKTVTTTGATQPATVTPVMNVGSASVKINAKNPQKVTVVNRGGQSSSSAPIIKPVQLKPVQLNSNLKITQKLEGSATVQEAQSKRITIAKVNAPSGTGGGSGTLTNIGNPPIRLTAPKGNNSSTVQHISLPSNGTTRRNVNIVSVTKPPSTTNTTSTLSTTSSVPTLVPLPAGRQTAIIKRGNVLELGGTGNVRYVTTQRPQSISVATTSGGGTATKLVNVTKSGGNSTSGNVPPLYYSRNPTFPQQKNIQTTNAQLQKITSKTMVNAGTASNLNTSTPTQMFNIRPTGNDAVKRKSTALNDLTMNRSLTVTEVRKNLGNANKVIDITGSKRAKISEGVTISPRNSQMTNRNIKKNPSVVDIVELE